MAQFASYDGTVIVGVVGTDEQSFAAVERRSEEPWYPAAMTAVRKAEAGDDSSR